MAKSNFIFQERPRCVRINVVTENSLQVPVPLMNSSYRLKRFKGDLFCLLGQVRIGLHFFAQNDSELMRF